MAGIIVLLSFFLRKGVSHSVSQGWSWTWSGFLSFFRVQGLKTRPIRPDLLFLITPFLVLVVSLAFKGGAISPALVTPSFFLKDSCKWMWQRAFSCSGLTHGFRPGAVRPDREQHACQVGCGAWCHRLSDPLCASHGRAGGGWERGNSLLPVTALGPLSSG